MKKTLIEVNRRLDYICISVNPALKHCSADTAYWSVKRSNQLFNRYIRSQYGKKLHEMSQ